MPNPIWHDYLVFVSAIACIAGLFLILNPNTTQASDLETDERVQLLTIFSYWLVHCVSFGILKLKLPEWDILLLSLNDARQSRWF